jgi:hypothetical protein
MANSLRVDLKDGDVVLLDPKEMCRAMRGWGEYNCLFQVDGGLNEPGMRVYTAGHLLGGRFLFKGPDSRRHQMQVSDILVDRCRQTVERCRNCGQEHGIWKRSDGTPIKGQPCPGDEPVTQQPEATPQPIGQRSLF